MLSPIRTPRLIIRNFTEDDLDALVARRNDPRVAEYQTWEMPYTMELAKGLAVGLLAMEGPTNDEWWMATVDDAATGAIIGDLALHLSWGGRTAEVGYTLSSEHWGHGYAIEAVEAFIEYCFETLGVTRVFGMLHPDNIASAQVLERCGLLFEGHTRSSYWVGDEVSDDWIYGLTRPDWVAWTQRDRSSPNHVELIEMDMDNVWKFYRLATHKTQERFVAPMTDSFADALFPEIVDGAPAVPWMRGVVADGAFVGFVMLAMVTEHHPEPFLWRLLIDRLHQRRGIGGRVLELVVGQCREWGASSLVTSWGEGRGSPRPFYESNGFVATGRLVDEETEARVRF